VAPIYDVDLWERRLLNVLLKFMQFDYLKHKDVCKNKSLLAGKSA
jgi:hypothetical protein